MKLDPSIPVRTALGSLAAVLVVSLALAANTQAATTVLNAVENSDVQTNFTLDFTDLGFVSSSRVVATRFDLEIDPQAGTARFTDYVQLVEPLLLPMNISTGPIEVRIVSSSGTYDPTTKTFETNDEYEIRFTNDLSFFGFSSPVVIPSTSRGTVDGGAANARSIGMVWEGSGQLENSDNPDQPFQYTYTCESRTVIADPVNIPALPSVQTLPVNLCGVGTCGGGGLGAMTLAFLGMGLMKVNARRRR